MVKGHIVGSAVDVLESRQNFAQLPFYGLENRKDILEVGQCQEYVVGCLGGWWSENGYTRNYTERSFCTNEQLLKIVACRRTEMVGLLSVTGGDAPVLSLRKEDSWSSTVPSGRTTSRPSTVPWREPYRKRRRPPAFVEIFPPI